MRHRVTYLLNSPWLWALVPALAVSLFLDEIGKPVRIEAESGHSGASGVMLSLYADLNLDGYSELIHCRSGPPLNNIPVMDQEGRHFEQWNIPGEINSGISQFFEGNYDNDGFAELYLFTTKSDSVFLNVNEILEPGGTRFEQKFITRVNLIQGVIDSNLAFIGFFDRNNDGKKELYFSISSGFALAPRHCYFYDLADHTLSSTPFTGVNFNTPSFGDLDNDGRPEVLSTMTASGNYHTPTPFTDYSAWLMVLDDSLRFKFPPVEFAGFGGSLHLLNLGKENNQKLYAVYNYIGTDTIPVKPCVRVYTPEGKLIRESNKQSLGIQSSFSLPYLLHEPSGNRMLIAEQNDKRLLKLSEDLKIEIQIALPAYDRIEIVDIDLDGADEILAFHDNYKSLTLYSSGLEPLGTAAMPGLADVWRHSWIKNAGHTRFFMHLPSKGNLLILEKVSNPFYWLGYLAYPAVYAGFALFLVLLKRATVRQVEKRERQKRQIQTLQLQSVKAQLDPHFTFNALNSVASLLYHDDRHTAYDYLNKFTRLLRQLLSDAERVYRSLDEEIEFVTAYLNLEKLRFGDKFAYSITVGDGITGKEQVPVMVLQTFAENSIKHGLMPVTSDGRLDIRVEKENDYLKLTIEDNGIGRKAAAEANSRKGKGLRMVTEFYGLLNQLNTRPIRHSITDLYDTSGRPSGTRVEVWVPA